MQRNKPTFQDYSAYTPEDFAVWKLLYNRQMPYVQAHASQLYQDALQHIGFTGTEIPNFEATSAILKKATGWQLTVVPELVPQKEFFEMLTAKVFPATCWLRSMDELDYIEEPDMFHDVFGHVPLLVNTDYAAFMQSFGNIAMRWINNPEAISILARVYWYTIEFGLLREGEEEKIFGAGLISSIGETKYALTDAPRKRPFDVLEMLNSAYRIDVFQEQYFVIDSFEQLRAGAQEIDRHISAILSAQLTH